MTEADWRRLIEQLGYLPGGAARARPEYFGGLLAEEAGEADDAVDDHECIERWPLRVGGALCLRANGGALTLTLTGGNTPVDIADAGPTLLATAGAAGVSPLLLLLLAIATGQIDDGRRLKRAARGIDGAARDLMLMSVCRLCG